MRWSRKILGVKKDRFPNFFWGRKIACERATHRRARGRFPALLQRLQSRARRGTPHPASWVHQGATRSTAARHDRMNSSAHALQANGVGSRSYAPAQKSRSRPRASSPSPLRLGVGLSEAHPRPFSARLSLPRPDTGKFSSRAVPFAFIVSKAFHHVSNAAAHRSSRSRVFGYSL